MDFYEELGVGPAASAEEIHRAYKHLAKQFHPDLRAGDNHRRWAESRMRRINEIYETLSDPVLKARYDESLRELSVRQILDDQGFQNELDRSERTRVRWRIAAAAACLFSIAGVALFFSVRRSEPADTAIRPRIGAPSQEEKPVLAAAPSPPARPAAVPTPSAKQASVRAPAREFPPGTSPSPQAQPEAPTPSAPVPGPQPSSTPSASPEEQVAAHQTAPGNDSGPTVVSHTIEGTWVFSPPRAAARVPATNLPFAASRVAISIAVVNGRASGQFEGHYHVGATRLAPLVQLRFEGPEKDLNEGIPWTSDNGAGGVIKFHLLSDRELEAGWYTTRFASTPALTSGHAILTRSAAAPH